MDDPWIPNLNSLYFSFCASRPSEHDSVLINLDKNLWCGTGYKFMLVEEEVAVYLFRTTLNCTACPPCGPMLPRLSNTFAVFFQKNLYKAAVFGLSES